MGRIDAPTGEIESVGAGIAAAAPQLASAGAAVRGTQCLSDPPATAAALEGLASSWATAADRLQDEIAALGHAAQATAIAYRVTDQGAMGGGG